MAPNVSQFRLDADSSHTAPPTTLSAFHISAIAPTDLWRKLPSLDVHNVPTYTTDVKFGQFRRARVTVSAEWKRLYDQGGLIFLMPAKGDALPRWVKTGIEFHDERPNLSTVAAKEGADWSLVPLTNTSVTLEIEREIKDGVLGPSLWIYFYEGEKRTAVREITWVWDGSVADDDVVKVGAYSARPTEDPSDRKGTLKVDFTELTIETA